VQLRLSPRAVELVQATAAAGKVRPWQVVDRLILAALDTLPGGNVATLAPGPEAPPIPPEVLEIAQECAAFLEAQEDRRAALEALRRAWKQALALAQRDLRAVP